MSLDKNTRNKIVEFLSHHMEGTETRRRFLKAAFDKYERVSLSSQIDVEGSESEFLDRLIERLLVYGFVEEDMHAISALLDELYPYYGVDRQAEIQQLQVLINERLKRGSSQAAASKPAMPVSQPPQYSQHPTPISSPPQSVQPAQPSSNNTMLIIGVAIATLVIGLGLGYILFGNDGGSSDDATQAMVVSTEDNDSGVVAAAESTDTPTPEPDTEVPTNAPTDTPVPTNTPEPPTATDAPTNTPIPPTLVPTSTPEPVLVYEEDFEDESSRGWIGVAGSSWAVTRNEQLQNSMLYKPGGSYDKVIYLESHEWEDVVIEFETLVANSLDVHLCEDTSLGIHINEDGDYISYRNLRSQNDLLSVSTRLIPNFWITVRIEIRNVDVQVSIDSEDKLSFNLLCSDREFGIASESSLIIDNIRVWSLDEE